MALTRIETDLIADSSITADKIANSAVTQTKIDSSVELGGGLDVIVDKFTGNGTTTQYTITETPTDEDKTIVIIEGVVQLKNSYSVSGNVVTFSSAIPNNYNFEIISFAGSGGGGGGSGPKITTVEVTNSGGTVIDDTAVDIAGGYIKITGTGFVTGCQVIVNNVAATSTTFVSSTVVRAQLPATAAGTYFVYVVNPDGGVAIKINGVTFSASPTWVTGSTLSGVVDQAISVQLNATDATTYTLQSGSTLPAGLTLTSGGLLSGTVTGITQETVYSFTIIATDAQNQESSRTFNLTVNIITFPSTVDYLVVAGGGGGGSTNSGSGGGGGGGAGGLLYGTTLAAASGTTYTITVGSGGSGGAAIDGTATNGGNSVISSSAGTTITSFGGGRGGNTQNVSLSGGSGGGTYAGTTGFVAGQGNPGGAGNGDPSYSGGGGGGAGAAGGGGAGSTCPGGVGLQYDISGTSTYYAGGGGGGGRSTSGAGGLGGGAAGNSGTAGTVNTGGGGGGASGIISGNGGSGIVIIRYPSTYFAASSTTGSPTVTVSGGYRVYKFTASGTLTF
jgi:hypothetical protein